MLLAFQPVDDSHPKTIKLRFDIVGEELDGPTDQVVALGPTSIDVVHFKSGEEHRVFTDPEGNEFNLVLPEPGSETAPAS